MKMIDALLAAVLGYGVVFFGLILLMGVIILTGKVMSNISEQAKAAPPAAATADPVMSPVPSAPPAPGCAGEVKLFNVSDREAAMLMAIVAHQMGKPLNELRFKSIKEVK